MALLSIFRWLNLLLNRVWVVVLRVVKLEGFQVHRGPCTRHHAILGRTSVRRCSPALNHNSSFGEQRLLLNKLLAFSRLNLFFRLAIP